MSVNTIAIEASADVSIQSDASLQLSEVKEIPTNWDFSGTKEVRINYIKLHTTLSVGDDYIDAGHHHSFFIKFNLILKNRNVGVHQKTEWIKRSHLVELFGENLVSDFESANVVALQNRLQELSAKAGA
jgi:hypothetical protein